MKRGVAWDFTKKVPVGKRNLAWDFTRRSSDDTEVFIVSVLYFVYNLMRKKRSSFCIADVQINIKDRTSLTVKAFVLFWRKPKHVINETIYSEFHKIETKAKIRKTLGMHMRRTNMPMNACF